jgi:16S rRNA processing protein RimM
MAETEYIEIGHIAKLHGFKGEVSLFLDVTNPSDYLHFSFFLVELSGVLTPFIVESIKPKNKGFVALKFEGINSESDAKFLLKKKVMVSAEILPELDENSFYDHEIEGFQVIDTERGNIGTVVGVIDHPSNPLLQLTFQRKEILIPLNLDLSKKVDRKDKTLTITCPEGLLEIYLG